MYITIFFHRAGVVVTHPPHTQIVQLALSSKVFNRQHQSADHCITRVYIMLHSGHSVSRAVSCILLQILYPSPHALCAFMCRFEKLSFCLVQSTQEFRSFTQSAFGIMRMIGDLCGTLLERLGLCSVIVAE